MKFIRIKELREIAIVELKGNLVSDEQTDVIRKEVNKLFDKGIKKIILGFSKVPWMNSNGMGMMMAIYSSASRVNARIGLACIHEKVRSIMMITRVQPVIRIFWIMMILVF